MRNTLITTLAMMGASILFVGSLSLIASAAAGKAVGTPAESSVTESSSATPGLGKAEPTAGVKASRRSRPAKGKETP